MAISASMVKELREMTGAGMMECKKALTETDGDMDAAVEVLRKSGAAKMEKKASRIAAEGIARAASNDKEAVVVEVNSETDFVAKNEVFQEFVQTIADTALTSGLNGGANGEDIDEIMEMNIGANGDDVDENAETKSLQELLIEKTATIGEKLSVRRFERVTGDCVASYLHAGGKIGVLVAAEGASDAAAKEALTNLAMQIAAMQPEYISRADISQAEVDKIREITIDSSLNDPASLPKPILQRLLEKAVADGLWDAKDVSVYEENKNDKFLFNKISDAATAAVAGLAMEDKANITGDKIFSGMVEGRISKQLKEISLMDQTYVKAEDGKQSVAKYLESVNKDLKITKFVRFAVGEGMEKKNEDFAAEVAAQLG